jgi:hypothetical protein
MKAQRLQTVHKFWILCCIVPLVFQVGYAQQGGHFRVTITTDAVHFIVTDPLGRRAGADPRGAPNPRIGIDIIEIPDAVYAAETVGDIPDKEGDPVRIDYAHVLTYSFDSPIDGTHLIQAIGVRNSVFDLYVTVSPDDDNAIIQPFRVKTKGLAQKDSVVEYRFDYRSQPGMPITFEKVVRSNTLRQDLAAAYKLKLLGDQKLFDDWNKEIDKFERDLARKDSAKARQELEKFGKELDKQREETIKHEERGQKDKRFITKDAYDILKDDVTILLKQLPEKKEK